MMLLARPNTSFASAILGLVITGILCLGIAFVLWFTLLAADSVLYFFQASRHMHQPSYDAFSFVGSAYGVVIGYGLAFFVGGLLAARPRWSYRPGLSAFLAYGAFLAIYLPFLDWTRSFTIDILSLIVPLLTSPLGGFLGGRLFAKAQSA